jgi:hypothetical protein
VTGRADVACWGGMVPSRGAHPAHSERPPPDPLRGRQAWRGVSRETGRPHRFIGRTNDAPPHVRQRRRSFAFLSDFPAESVSRLPQWLAAGVWRSAFDSCGSLPENRHPLPDSFHVKQVQADATIPRLAWPHMPTVCSEHSRAEVPRPLGPVGWAVPPTLLPWSQCSSLSHGLSGRPPRRRHSPGSSPRCARCGLFPARVEVRDCGLGLWRIRRVRRTSEPSRCSATARRHPHRPQRATSMIAAHTV